MAQAVAEYLDEAIEGFDRDPPTSDFQKGFLEALKTVRAEAVRDLRDDDFAMILDTERGQLLVYKDDSGDDYGLRVVGAPVRGVTPSVTLGYPTDGQRQENFDSFNEHAEKAAQSLFEIADQTAAKEPA